MDSITHIVLGATLGEAMAGPKLKKRAMLFGAIAQSLPDIDFVAALWSDPAADLLAHRGFTHSFLFVALIAPALAWLGKRWNKDASLSFQAWCIFFGSQLLIHDFLDAFNAYGTGWFEPFSHARFSFNILFVADPSFTLWSFISSLALLLTPWNSKLWRLRWTRLGLILSSLYLVCAVTNKLIVDHIVEKNFKEQSIRHDQYFTTPTPLNTFLWYIVAADKDGYHIGYRSVFDRDPVIDFKYFVKNDSLLNPIRNRKDVQNLVRFSQDYYIIRNTNDTLVFSDLRFGQMAGWHNPNSGFVFYYYLKNPGQNKMVIQRGRFSNWNRSAVAALWKRIKGNR